jgi:hypothetical protein
MFSLLYSSKKRINHFCHLLLYLSSVTIQNVQEQSHDLWRYQRFLIVNEFSKKTPLPPPFNIIYYIIIIARFLLARLKLYRSRRRYGMYQS